MVAINLYKEMDGGANSDGSLNSKYFLEPSELIGGGGQGAVYKVTLTIAGRIYIMSRRWVFPRVAFSVLFSLKINIIVKSVLSERFRSFMAHSIDDFAQCICMCKAPPTCGEPYATVC